MTDESENIEYIFEDKGLLSRHLKGYLMRTGQLQLAIATQTAIEKGVHLLAEAPTGTGKSLGTGFPAALYAMGDGTPVVYVTANITLQEQLIHKDLPMIARVLGGIAEDEDGHEVPFRFSLLKGMGNYLCLASLNDELHKDNISRDILEIATWSHKTETGDKSELSKEYSKDIWSRVSTSSDECIRSQCPHESSCHIFNARRKAQEGHVVVTNYHMWFTDFIVRELTQGQVSFLPDHKVVIMDEAHEAPGIAMDFQGFQLTRGKLAYAFRRLGKQGSEEARAVETHGLLCIKQFFAHLQKIKRDETTIIEGPLGWDHDLVLALSNASMAYKKLSETILGDDERSQVHRGRFKLMAKTSLKLHGLIRSVAFGMIDKSDPEVEQGPQWQLGSRDEIGVLSPDDVYYIDDDGKGGIELCCKAVNPQAFFRKHVFSQKTAVMMSATLSTNQDFDFIRSQFGLKADEFHVLQAPTPFNPDRVLGVIPKKFPKPNSSAHSELVAKWLHQFVMKGSGGVMCLFTSYKNMGRVKGMIEKQQGGYHLFVQGELPKLRIIEQFVEAYDKKEKAIILATSSFWQGVDIPGKALSVVAIDKLPFARPDDPVMWYLDMEGRNAFFEYSVPQAIIAVKQGIGRLIRSESDFGVVVIFDTRIHTKNYGGVFKSALPGGCFLSEDLNDVTAFLAHMNDRSSTIDG